MNESTLDMIMLPSDLERQQIFYWLKKISSVTAWQRILGYYESWAAAVEGSVRIADEKGCSNETSLPQSEYALILKCVAHCEEGVRRLSKGDKRVFKFDANGEFVMAQRMLTHWTSMLQRIEWGENGIKPQTPLWSEFCHALTALAQAWAECGSLILEPRYFEDPAQVAYGQWLKNELVEMPFPPSLPQIPDPLDNIFVMTGQRTPFSGVWEPIEGPVRSLISLIKRTPKPQPPFKIAGAMNYLHAGSNAPQVTVETENDSTDQDTTWRLLWRDERYTDGTVPEEEMDYRFTKPDKVLPPAPKIWVPEKIIWGESGTPASVAGRWLAEFDINASVTLEKGEKLPMHQGREVRWIWTKE